MSLLLSTLLPVVTDDGQPPPTPTPNLPLRLAIDNNRNLLWSGAYHGFDRFAPPPTNGYGAISIFEA